MKKIVLLLALAALATPRAFAQDDNMILNHLSLGVTAGVDGIGLEATMPATPSLQIRAGYSLMPFTYRNTFDLGTVDFEEHTFDLSHLPVAVKPWKGGLGKFLVDYYPCKTGSFHLTAGTFFGSGKLGAVTADFREVIDPIDYRTGVGIHNLSFSTDEEGFVHGDGAVWKVMPYLGIGFGRTLDPAKRVRFTCDLGAVCNGGIDVVLYNYSRKDEVESCVAHSSDLVMDGKQLDKGLVDKISGIAILPMLRMGIHVRLF